ncbi:MAG: disulfide bond formation protein DsbA [Rhizobacter sp.]|nr:disulfide bond formation protein DsbA [Rhizobacter sp.]
MHHLIFTSSQHLSAASLRGMAQTLSLDITRFDADMADHLYLQRVQEHRAIGERAGVRATPAFYLNGEFVDVSFGLEHLVKRVEEAMASPHGQQRS